MTTPGLTPSQLNYAESSQWKQIVRQALDDTRCASPGFLVEDMDAVHQTVTVQIAIQERVRPQSGAAQWWDIPPIVNVPVVLPRGGGFSFTLPLKKGDKGLLIFCDACFDLWWQNGTGGAPKAYNAASPSGSQKQLEVRRHYVHDCGFLPGMGTQKDLLDDYSTDSLQIRSDDGSVVIDMKEPNQDSTLGQVTITAHNVTVNATQATVNGTTVTIGEATTIDGRVFLDHVHINVAPGVVNTGPVA